MTDNTRSAVGAAALALGLLGGITAAPLALTALLMALVVASLWIGDHPALMRRSRHQIIMLDRAITDEDALIAHLEQLLDAQVRSVEVQRLDLVNDTTLVDVRFRLHPTGDSQATPSAARTAVTAPAPALPFEDLAAEATHVLVEADGAAGRPLKAHRPWEPVIPACSGMTVCVVGASGIGRPAMEVCHCPELFCELAGMSADAPVQAEHIARVINRESRDLDKATDVLSFPMFQLTAGYPPEDWSEYRDPATGLVPLGDMCISLERAKAQAEEFGHSLRREVGYLTIHSMLHLLGYDHLDEGKMKRHMRRREEAIAASIPNMTRD